MSSAVVRRLMASVAVVVVLGGAGAFAYWWTHASVFRTVGFGLSYDRVIQVGTGGVTAGVLVPFEDDNSTVVMLRGASANFAPDSARASVTFSICDGSVTGLVVTPSHPHCSRVSGLPGRLDLRSTSHESLLMSVRPTSAGLVRIDSISISYREGAGSLWRRGSETLPITLSFTAR